MKRLLALTGCLAFLTACNGGKNQTNIELIQNMMDQPSIKSQDWIPEQGDKGQMLVPPAHSVSRNRPPYPFADDPEKGDKQQLACFDDHSPETIATGKKYFEIYCSICHGVTGAGDGTVAQYMALKPRNLISPEAKAYPPGRIYQAISAGRGAMRSYISQLPEPEKRCAVVNYVRELQK